MRLKAQRSPIAVAKAGVRRKLGSEDHFGVGRRGDDLVLMAARDSKRRQSTAKPAILDRVSVSAQAPAFFRFPHIATQGIGHDLVAEADAHHRYSCGISLANEGAHWRHPREVLVIDTR